MKKLSNEVIEQGARLLDVGTFAEFEAFARLHIKDTSVRKMLLDTALRFVRSENRGRAIALWREAAGEYRELEAGETKDMAREMLRAGEVSSLSKDECRRAEIAFAAIQGEALALNSDPKVLAEGAELAFAYAVLIAKQFSDAASDLGVRLPSV